MKKVITIVLIVLIIEWMIAMIYEWYIIGSSNIVLGVLFPITISAGMIYIIVYWKKK